MGKIGRPRQVRLFASIIFRRDADVEGALRVLGGAMGPIEEKTPPALFTHTTYYDREMGEGLMRSFILFSPLVDREVLPDIKIFTNATEDLF
ncbi:MAG TPA: DUF4416 family protein, partial [Syntrophorhabdaceae bacterium]|nr:DUF4416 family protein [Syntrophorhabdaceae bacterium]